MAIDAFIPQLAGSILSLLPSLVLMDESRKVGFLFCTFSYIYICICICT